ncbi:MAG: hypothetical protein J6U01_03195 [Clostridia bacterium]|nr:hypothetical protein [Clostridia bacterium]
MPDSAQTSLYLLLPLTEDPRQVFSLDLMLEGEPFQARIELRYFPAPDQWMLSLWDHASGELLVSQIPLICSLGEVNDLFAPFAHLRGGKGLGSLWVMRAAEAPDTPDPAEFTLKQFNLLWGNTL